jgi:hypothetical protein
MSDIFGDSTTAATASPTMRQHALSIGGDTIKLQEVSEIPFLKNAITNTYRKSRLLQKGCPKLIKLVEKHHGEIDRSIIQHQRVSARLANHITASERVKMSILETRSNLVDSPFRHHMMEDRNLSGLNTSKNAYVTRHKAAATTYPSMALERSNGSSS